MAKRLKRPRDRNQLAKLIVDIATSQTANDSHRPEPKTEEPAWRRKDGRKGAKARAKKLSAEKRSAIANKAARTRWKRPADHVWSLEEIAKLAA